MKRGWLITLLVVILGIAATFFFAVYGGGRSSQKTPDGSFVRLLRVHYGTSERMFYGNWWQRLTGRFVPAAQLKAWRWPVSVAQHSNDVLFVWLESVAVSNTPPQLMVGIADELGLESPRAHLARGLRHSNAMLHGFTCESFPRRAKALTVNVYALASNQWLRAGQFSVRNPVTLKAAPAASDPLPQRHQEGDQMFTLVQANTGLTATGLVAQVYPATSWTELVFKIGTNEPAQLGTNYQPYGDWTIKRIGARDSSGNIMPFREPVGRIAGFMGVSAVWRRDDGVAMLQGALWPNDPWTITVEFERLRFMPPLSNDTVRLPLIDIPPPGVTNRLDLSAKLHDSVVHLTSIGAAPLSSVTNTNAFVQARIPVAIQMEYTRTPSVNGISVVTSLDERGQKISRMGVLPDRAEKEIHLWPLRTMKSVDLKLGVNRTYTAEYTVRPTIVRTNVLHWLAR